MGPELPCDLNYPATTSIRLETTNAGSGRSIAQQVFDVFLPSRRSDEVCCATDPASLEQTRSVSFLQRNREPSVPRVQKSNFPPPARCCDLRIALCDGVHRSPEPLQCLRREREFSALGAPRRDPSEEGRGCRSPAFWDRSQFLFRA